LGPMAAQILTDARRRLTERTTVATAAVSKRLLPANAQIVEAARADQQPKAERWRRR